MTDYEFYIDQYESYEQQFNSNPQRRRRRKANYKPKKSPQEILAEVTDGTGLEDEFETTYQPSRYEGEWLLSSLRSFYEQGLITDVLALVKGGKEANVYRCEAHPATGMRWLAAKVYRPRKFRNLRNDKMYRQGRATLSSNGSELKNSRAVRALDKKTGFGLQLAHTSWLMHEYSTLERLHQAGAAVPQAIAPSDNAILMSYHGDEQMAAPTLNQISLAQDEATELFAELLRNIDLMLRHDLIHGDLSAYNILIWEGELTIIDFPQVTNIQSNNDAYSILGRDIRRVCDYFAQQGVACDAKAIHNQLWARYIEMAPEERAAARLADLSGELDLELGEEEEEEEEEFPRIKRNKRRRRGRRGMRE